MGIVSTMIRARVYNAFLVNFFMSGFFVGFDDLDQVCCVPFVGMSFVIVY